MSSKPFVRKRPAHQPIFENHNLSRIIFLTVCTHQRKHILCNDDVLNLVVQSWRKADSWVVGRFVLMPDHIHLFCSPVGNQYPALKSWISYWKSLSARQWPDQSVGKVWQRDFWDTQLRRGESYSEKWGYVRNNPVRAELVENVEQWKYLGELNVLHWHD
jgi:REP element-mobilizing transposase RayT